MTIGLPRAFLYHKYQYLWETFFKVLGFDIILSEETNKKMLEDGIKHSIDESCLPAKIYMGHIQSLIGKCDYILVPRISSFGHREMTCTKFYGIYDIVKNTFEDINLLDYNIDLKKGESECKGFIKMGKILGKNYIQSYHAYKMAKKSQELYNKKKTERQNSILVNQEKLKILVVSHPYITYDKLIGSPILEYLEKLETMPIYADAADSSTCINESKKISSSMYWTYNKELLGSIEYYKDLVDGIILLTAFPCGPDSLVNELIIRKFKSMPIINIILDELQGEAGIQTRIESFIDIIKEKRRRKVG